MPVYAQDSRPASFWQGEDHFTGDQPLNWEPLLNDRSWPGAAVAHTRRNRTLEKSEILRLTAYGLKGEFTLSARSGRSWAFRNCVRPNFAHRIDVDDALEMAEQTEV